MSKPTYTKRGFRLRHFKDANGVPCNIQKSSSACADLIWLGAEEIGLQKFIPGDGWQEVPTPKGLGVSYIANNRMHLSRANVRRLLPILRHFADTGELP